MKKNSANDEPLVNVLVVDDEEGIRAGAARILKRMNCQVSTAPRGDEALRIMEESKFAIVLLDLKMPGMDGMEVLQHIHERDASVLVIIITGFATVETAIEAMKKGAYDFIPKPFEPDHLRIVVRRAQEKLRLRREREQLMLERQRTLFDLDMEKSRIRTIIESLPNGLVVTNARGQVVLMNEAFIRHLGLPPDKGPGDQIENYILDEEFCNLVKEVSQGKGGDSEDITPCEIALPGDRYFLARGRPVMGEDGERLGAVITLVNITAMKVLDQMKSEFVAKVSHELRSPLSTIHEQLAMVLSDMVKEDPEKEQHILSRAKEKTQGLISLIGDLLDLSRIESGVMAHEPKPVPVDELLRSIVDFLGARAKAKSQSLVAEISEDTRPVVMADIIGLESIFGNLIANAINYTPEGGEIRVIVQITGENVVVKVADNGFGIEARHQEKIFDRFFRVKDDNTRYITGTGLGLPIVKGLVDSLDGTIAVDSAPGKGSTFIVRLPLEN